MALLWDATRSGRCWTPLARVHRPDLVVALARDMIEAPQPMSYRRGASCTAPPGGWRAWEKKLLAAFDRAGHRAFEAISDAGQKAISGALLPVMAPDAVLCTGGFVTYERIAKDERIPHFALNGGRRTKRTPRSHLINTLNTVNALISRFRAFIQPFCAPASKNLAAYGRLHAALNNAGRSYIDALRLLLASSPRTNTVR